MPDASVELKEGTADESAFDDHDEEDDNDLSVENSLRRTGAWLTRITGCYHQMILDCAQRGVSSLENAAVRSMVGKIRSMENRSVRLIERAQNTFDEEDARQAFLMTEMFKNEVTYLEEFSQSLPAEADSFFSQRSGNRWGLPQRWIAQPRRG